MAEGESTQDSEIRSGVRRNVATQNEDEQVQAFDLCKGLVRALLCDDSMECEDQEKSIPANAIVTFDGGIRAVAGKVVIAKIDSGLCVRELAEIDGAPVLRARNRAYPDIVLDSPACVLATAIKMETCLYSDEGTHV